MEEAHRLKLCPLSQPYLEGAGKLLHLMNPDVSPETLAERLAYMCDTYSHYHCILALNEQKELLGLTGYWIAHRTWCGKYIEADNIIVSPDHRGHSVGKRLMEEIERIGCKENCNVITLDAYTSNRAAHRFYFRQGYEIYGFHFVKELSLK